MADLTTGVAARAVGLGVWPLVLGVARSRWCIGKANLLGEIYELTAARDAAGAAWGGSHFSGRMCTCSADVARDNTMTCSG